ncbi:hypothetical protein B5S28_g3726 [[Candida] boidinii]|nr:hypothetical protein B5S28_g3726 [[Candida] boidinii]OWB60355.1 hypothetical protein B5S29_g1228 [[Candida] boidinii]OWB72627.1 hypothetical protein B5S31_g2344 [[Candida] boidinii]OWB76617.1 hypothetical protein B5S32_g771 [[Candida] boidinii]GME69099.1 unnamed protein product [[Candida] boidinii]
MSDPFRKNPFESLEDEDEDRFSIPPIKPDPTYTPITSPRGRQDNFNDSRCMFIFASMFFEIGLFLYTNL